MFPRLLRIFIFLSLVTFHFSLISYAQEIGQQMEGFNLEGYKEGGAKAWDVKGKTADIVGDTIAITNVDANNYGDQTVNLKAETGVIDKATGNVELKTDVVITSETGSQLKTDTLNLDKQKDLVSTSDPVTITDKNMTATGTGLTARPGMETAQMEKDVNVKVQVEPDKDPNKIVTITCDGPMTIEEKKSMATFNDNVVAVQDDRTLKADKVEIYFDTDKKKIKELICIGHVQIIQGENKTFAERAVYNADDQKIVLSGQPKLILITTENGGLAGFDKKK